MKNCLIYWFILSTSNLHTIMHTAQFICFYTLILLFFFFFLYDRTAGEDTGKGGERWGKTCGTCRVSAKCLFVNSTPAHLWEHNVYRSALWRSWYSKTALEEPVMAPWDSFWFWLIVELTSAWSAAAHLIESTVSGFDYQLASSVNTHF